ncbi:MAG: PEP-CTERM sorting domain-containing protein [Bryobacterales bacterium]|nr:PEP-CTERM sorting domain-containing protein [Bryobacterales bacterium]
MRPSPASMTYWGWLPVDGASPVPEPSTGVMLLLGIVLLRRRRA